MYKTSIRLTYEHAKFIKESELSQQEIINLALANILIKYEPNGIQIELTLPTKTTKKLLKYLGKDYTSISTAVDMAINRN